MMGIKELLTFWKDGPEVDKEPPPEDEWPISVEILDQEGFDEFIEKYPLSIVDFSSPRCRPCKAMSSRIRKLSKRYENDIAFGKVNIVEEKEIAERLDIVSVPTFLFFRYGKRIEKMKGKKPLSELRNTLDELLNRYGEG